MEVEFRVLTTRTTHLGSWIVVLENNNLLILQSFEFFFKVFRSGI
jgi:hypothetical protein